MRSDRQLGLPGHDGCILDNVADAPEVEWVTISLQQVFDAQNRLE